MPQRFGPRDFPMPTHHGGWGADVFHIVLMMALLAATVALVVWIVNTARKPAFATAAPVASRSSVDTALHEARMRYVRGEVTREQFLQIAGDLAARPPADA
ncbi:MAG: hypothetical protein ABR548_00355 [Actinomycetota bacterium]|nr:hypothetical protein [Actinomycetota bacterium]